MGQLGVGASTSSSLNPVAVSLPGQAKIIVAGKDHTCAALQDETLWCWGANDKGQVGQAEFVTNQFLPAQVNLVWPQVPTENPTTQPSPSPTLEPPTPRPNPLPTTLVPSISPTVSPTERPSLQPATNTTTWVVLQTL